MKTQCKNGHEYTPENTQFNANGTYHCRLCRSATDKNFKEKRKREGTFSIFKRKARLRELGWTPEAFEKTWKEQSGKCAICEKILNLEKVQNEARACADHKHVDPPQPRGILCTNCNAMLGQAKENPSILRMGAEYLEKFLLEIPAEVVKIKLKVSASLRYR